MNPLKSMCMNPKINYNNLIRQLLPPHKRQTCRLTFLQGLITPLQTLFNNFNIYRDDSRMMVNVNSQVMVLEGYLRKKYNEPVSIKVSTFNNGLLNIGLESEGTTMLVWIGLTNENSMKNVPLKDELRDKFQDADFVIFIPTDIDKLQIQADVEKYKLALVTYKIIQQ